MEIVTGKRQMIIKDQQITDKGTALIIEDNEHSHVLIAALL